MVRSVHPASGIKRGLDRVSGFRHRLVAFPLILSLSLSLFLSGAAWGEGKRVQVLTLQEALQIIERERDREMRPVSARKRQVPKAKIYKEEQIGRASCRERV